MWKITSVYTNHSLSASASQRAWTTGVCHTFSSFPSVKSSPPVPPVPALCFLPMDGFPRSNPGPMGRPGFSLALPQWLAHIEGSQMLRHCSGAGVGILARTASGMLGEATQVHAGSASQTSPSLSMSWAGKSGTNRDPRTLPPPPEEVLDNSLYQQTPPLLTWAHPGPLRLTSCVQVTV